jgi:hypothetical protein
MMDKYINNYNTLGIQPGANWKELRSAYKNLVKTWHPDRFQQDANQKKIAEERTKEINKSYKELAEYYKKHGALPIDNETPRPRRDAVAPDKPEPSRKSASPPKNTASPAHAKPPVKEKSPRISRMAIMLGLVGAIYILWNLAATQPPSEVPQREETRLQMLNNMDMRNVPEGDAIASKEKFFTYGTSLGEVIAIQGVPTKTEKDVWYYGNSKIYFSEGSVIRWEENPGYLLKAEIRTESSQPKANFFATGSTKAEVMAVQGVPERDAGNVWDYGMSRVYFEKDRVTKWHESPLNPLKTRH